MKKRFTLMMMVLCFLMSIPLKMMADEVTIHFVDKESTKWESYAAYVYDQTITGNGSQPWVTDKWPGQKVTNSADIETLSNGYKVVTWKIDLKSCALSNALVIFNNQDNGKQYPASGKSGKEVKNGYYYYSDGTMSATAPSGTETGGGSTGPIEKWDTENTNRLTAKPRVYTQGFYLAGDFFTFDKVDGEYKINYNDAVFKFQQQNDQSIREAAETPYDVYMVEIPASLDAHAQVMYVDESGQAKKIFCPMSAYGISETCPTTEAKSTKWEILKGTEEFSENNNYWNFSSRNKRSDEYSDGLYEVYIAVDKSTHEPAKWMITHIADKRVAYFISDAPDATAIPLYDAYISDSQGGRFGNKFFATVNLAANRSYYVISNYVRDSGDADKAQSYGAFNPNLHAISCPTTTKLFMLGNAAKDIAQTDEKNQFNQFSPNEKPMPGARSGKKQSVVIVEYNPSMVIEIMLILITILVFVDK